MKDCRDILLPSLASALAINDIIILKRRGLSEDLSFVECADAPQACTANYLTYGLLLQVLAAEINFGYRFSNIRCLSVNGEDINNLAHLAKLVDGSR